MKRITLEDPDDDDELDKCQFVVGLLQKERRKLRLVGQDNLTIGFAIYKVCSIFCSHDPAQGTRNDI